MALQASGAISLGDIQTEFGGSNPISISEYYGEDTGIPASGTISFSDFYGTSSIVNPAFDSVLGYNAQDVQSGGGVSFATIRVATNGDVICTTGTDGTWWDNGATTASDFEIRMVSGTSNAGGFSGESTDTWLSLSSDRTWTMGSFNQGERFANGTLEIRKVGTTTVITSAPAYISAESFGGGEGEGEGGF